jgi:hypothetical protein
MHTYRQKTRLCCIDETHMHTYRQKTRLCCIDETHMHTYRQKTRLCCHVCCHPEAAATVGEANLSASHHVSRMKHMKTGD